MIVEKISQITGIKHQMNIDVTHAELERLAERRQGEYIQNLFPKLNPDEREFLLTGITPAEWKKFMKGL